jgi:signal transduction histidine kinase/CheY-like chemotaxis protein
MRPAAAQAAAPHEAREPVQAVLPLRRRRLGLALIALGVAALAVQSLLEWLLPYDVAVLLAVREWLDRPTLGAAALAWAWAACGCVLLAALAQPRLGPPALHGLALLCGLVLGSAHAALGGSAASVATLLLVAVASLGWQAGSQAGFTLLAGTAVAAAGWDALLSDYPTLWLVAVVLAATFAWIDRQHIRANDLRLLAALEQRDSLIADLDRRGEQLRLVQGARTRLLATISHDLRQPLQAIRLYAEALAGRPDCDGAARALLERQMQAADDAAAMLDQFSEFSAIEQGMLVSHPEPTNGRQVLERVAASLQATHPASRLRITVHGRAEGTWLSIDRSQFARVVQNLAGNAVRYSLGVRDAEPARVVLALRPHGNGLALDVVDNGCGIPADKTDLVFEPYVQLPVAPPAAAGANPARAGRGLGLAIVRGLATQLGLSIAPVRSRVGRGTRFRVVVPAALRRPPPRAQAGATAAHASRLDGWLLALLDDEDAPRAALRAALEGLGAAVVDAAVLSQLQPLLDSEARFPDALLFDLDLGSGQPDGRAAVGALRAEWELAVPAVILTGRVGSSSVILPPRCSLLDKPVRLADLVATLHRLAPRPTP